MASYINTELLPLDVKDNYWLHENSHFQHNYVDSGKWMLFYTKSLMNEAWIVAKTMYREKKLMNVISIKCSTGKNNDRASNLDKGVIILYCNNSSNQEFIMNIGYQIIELFGYNEEKIIYYKTDSQSYNGTIATGNKHNYKYKLFNHLYKSKYLLRKEDETVPQDKISVIERKFPRKQFELTYPKRYTLDVFEKFNEMKHSVELKNDYEKWENGINYNTNRKIKIGGEIYNDLMQKFMIHYCYNSNIASSVLFTDLCNINANEYLQETKHIENEIDQQNNSIKSYNKRIDITIDKIQQLDKWGHFVLFEGKKYGLTSKIVNYVHRENDCFGKMLYLKTNERECKGCRDGMPFNGRYTCTCSTYDIYKCNKCNYEDTF